jgi:hypothetical protein
MTLSPKSRFLKTTESKAHLDLVTQDYFQTALTVALAEMEMNMPPPGSPTNGWDNASQMQGAKRFIEVLLNLAEPPAPQKKPVSETLKPIN